MNETRRALPLHYKITAMVVAALAVLAIAAGVSNYSYFRSVLQREAVARGKAIADTLAQSITEMPDSSIPSTIAAVKKDANLAYVEVVGRGGQVLAHTFGTRAQLQD